MLKRHKLKDICQVLKGALEYMTGSIGEKLKLNMVLTWFDSYKAGRISMLGVAALGFQQPFPVDEIGQV